MQHANDISGDEYGQSPPQRGVLSDFKLSSCITDKKSSSASSKTPLNSGVTPKSSRTLNIRMNNNLSRNNLDLGRPNLNRSGLLENPSLLPPITTRTLNTDLDTERKETRRKASQVKQKSKQKSLSMKPLTG